MPGLFIPIIKTCMLVLSLYLALSLLVFMHSSWWWVAYYWWAFIPLHVQGIGSVGCLNYLMHRFGVGPSYAKEELEASTDKHEDRERSALGSEGGGAAMNYAIITPEFVEKDLAFLIQR